MSSTAPLSPQKTGDTHQSGTEGTCVAGKKRDRVGQLLVCCYTVVIHLVIKLLTDVIRIDDCIYLWRSLCFFEGLFFALNVLIFQCFHGFRVY